MVKFRTGFDGENDKVSQETGLDCSKGGPSKTQQQFAEEADINTIVRRFGLTGQLPNGVGMPLSGDFTKVVDFQTAMNLIAEAEEAFMQVPAETRARFEHDPAKMIEFLEDDKNRDEAMRLGLIEKPPEKTREPEPAK